MRDTWKEYYTYQLNQEKSNIIEDISPVLGQIHQVIEQETNTALKAMKPGKAVGPPGIKANLLNVV